MLLGTPYFLFKFLNTCVYCIIVHVTVCIGIEILNRTVELSGITVLPSLVMNRGKNKDNSHGTIKVVITRATILDVLLVTVLAAGCPLTSRGAWLMTVVEEGSDRDTPLGRTKSGRLRNEKIPNQP